MKTDDLTNTKTQRLFEEWYSQASNYGIESIREALAIDEEERLISPIYDAYQAFQAGYSANRGIPAKVLAGKLIGLITDKMQNCYTSGLYNKTPNSISLEEIESVIEQALRDINEEEV